MQAIFSNDDAGGSSSARAAQDFLMVAEWLAGLGLRGTFFWVPEPADHERAHEVWRPALERARALGHGFQLHGLSHGNCLEFGLPQESTRRANPRPFEEYAANREFWEGEHQREVLAEKLRRGMAHYQSLFDAVPLIFRAPCFGVCSQMYEALHDVGIANSSSRGLNPTATAYTVLGDPELRRWAPDFPCTPWTEPPGVVEHPAMEDLCLAGVPADQVADREDLIKSELSHCLRELGEDGVLVFSSHYGPMARTWETTRPLLERVLSWLSDQGVTEWVTFGEYLRE